MAEEIPLAPSGATSARGEFGRPLRLDQTTGPQDLARFLGAPSVVLTERAPRVPSTGEG